MAEAIKVFKQIGWDNIIEHEAQLTAYLLEKLKKCKRTIIYGNPDPQNSHNRLGVIPFNVEGIPHALLAAILSYEGGIGVRNGCFCAHTYVKELLHISQSQAKTLEKEIIGRNRTNIPGCVRASFGIYNNKEEIERLITILDKICVDGYAGEYELNAVKGEYKPRNFEMNTGNYFDF